MSDGEQTVKLETLTATFQACPGVLTMFPEEICYRRFPLVVVGMRCLEEGVRMRTRDATGHKFDLEEWKDANQHREGYPGGFFCSGAESVKFKTEKPIKEFAVEFVVRKK